MVNKRAAATKLKGVKKIHHPKLRVTKRKSQKYDEEITSEEEDYSDNPEENSDKNAEKPNKTIIQETREEIPLNIPKELTNKAYRKIELFTDRVASESYQKIRDFHASSCVSCLVVSNSLDFIICGSKDGRIVKYTFEGVRVHQIKSHKRNSKNFNRPVQPKGSILCMALSCDDRFLVTSSEDNLIFIWDAKTFKYIKHLIGHRSSVTGLCFQKDSYQLYSCGNDKMVKLWNVEKCGFIDTWYGHEAPIFMIDSLEKECAVTCASDSTIRFWKVFQQSQLVFNSSSGWDQLCVAMINEKIFVSGSLDGTLSLWSASLKKPLFTITKVHTQTPNDQLESSSSYQILSIAVIPFHDIIATGSHDGFIKLFSVVEEKRLEYIKSILCDGHVNSLKFSECGKYLIAGCGCEERLGRWSAVKNRTLNSVKVFML
ncbi:U3 small nucleolar RNA-interacting protein 2 [Thelohanellus kitauei]|uniref:U3 small nucleolar RNA-interacting protein 2 n=1 Tax=Thelohanellus kitauei TaxID=669202 RepID=A0A0C2M254_THEKT|nr:U3 small nucleolar RNA-interacting protein 2 [Thelohanellus kitauei]